MAADRRFQILLLLIVSAVAGCRTAPTIRSWQANVERYVADHNDPSALRDVTIAGGRRGFAVIGGVDPQKSTDINAVLLGHQTVDNRPWFIYLVGKVDGQKVEEIQLAAVSFADREPRWVRSAKDNKPTSLYRNYNEQAWRRKHPQGKPPAQYTAFPRDADAFDLNVSGTTIYARHQPSGAVWTADVSKAPH